MIQFEDREFETRVVDIPSYGEVLISVTSLNDLLMTYTGEYVSEEALVVDEEIFYFVKDHQFNLPNYELQKLITSEVL